jgi:hypothetical protein
VSSAQVAFVCATASVVGGSACAVVAGLDAAYDMSATASDAGGEGATLDAGARYAVEAGTRCDEVPGATFCDDFDGQGELAQTWTAVQQGVTKTKDESTSYPWSMQTTTGTGDVPGGAGAMNDFGMKLAGLSTASLSFDVFVPKSPDGGNRCVLGEIELVDPAMGPVRYSVGVGLDKDRFVLREDWQDGKPLDAVSNEQQCAALSLSRWYHVDLQVDVALKSAKLTLDGAPCTKALLFPNERPQPWALAIAIGLPLLGAYAGNVTVLHDSVIFNAP